VRFDAHDLPGYLSVVRFRGGKTIFTEGPSDRHAIARAIRQFEAQGLVPTGHIVVDCAQTVEIPGEGLGAREIVERVQLAANTEGLPLCSLTDREFRQFAATPDGFRDDLRTHNALPTGEVWTRGHSIENYFFDLRFVQRYLDFHYAGRVPSAALHALSEYWPGLLQNTAAVSVAAKNAALLGRLKGAFSLTDWAVQPPNGIRLQGTSIEQVAQSRGVSAADAARLRQDFESLLPASQSCCDLDCTRWISHGHLADELIWLGVAAVLQAHGTPATVALELSTGHRAEKERHRADEWARLHSEQPQGVETPFPLWQILGLRF
jgi:hypothetical protein